MKIQGEFASRLLDELCECPYPHSISHPFSQSKLLGKGMGNWLRIYDNIYFTNWSKEQCWTGKFRHSIHTKDILVNRISN